MSQNFHSKIQTNGSFNGICVVGEPCGLFSLVVIGDGIWTM